MPTLKALSRIIRMTTADREYAAQQLLAFLGQVGPLEAIWAMTTALEELQELPASNDHVAAAARAFAEAQAEDQVDVSKSHEEATAAPAKPRAKKVPAAEGEQP